MRALLLDGHPDQDRLSNHLLDAYQAGLAGGTTITRHALADLDFDANLARGYAQPQPLEPALERLWADLESSDHLTLAFPMWWGAEPARLKGLFDRLLLPGRAFAYHRDDPWWDRMLSGRSADVIITLDTPPLFLRFAWGNPLVRRMRHQVLGFVGFRPIRFHLIGPVRRGGADNNLGRWQTQMKRAAASATGLRRGTRWSKKEHA